MEQEENPQLSFGTQNDIFIVDPTKPVIIREENIKKEIDDDASDGENSSYNFKEKCIKKTSENYFPRQRKSSDNTTQSSTEDSSEEDHYEDDFNWQDDNDDFRIKPFEITNSKGKAISSHDTNRKSTSKDSKEPKKAEEIQQQYCSFCEKKFASKKSLKLHEVEVHTKQFSYFCDFCNRGFSRKDRLLEHLQSQHLRIPFICSFCGIEFTLQKNLKAHMVKHSDSNSDKNRCVHCSKVLADARSLRNHLMLHTR